MARHHDFFELGGDSLMATRMVAQLNRRGIARANLQDLFSHSTLSDFCAHLQAATSGEDNPIPLCQGDGEETLFVFHASDGDISAWLPLASALNRRVSCGGRRTAPVRQRRAGSDGVNRSRVPTGFLLRKPGGPAAPVSRRTNASGTARTFRPADARQPACRLYQPR
ncbi:TPA: hypothetical protein IGP89_003300 [Escherichia coli]|nr:hypothetical protein [Escherichia coli]